MSYCRFGRIVTSTVHGGRRVTVTVLPGSVFSSVDEASHHRSNTDSDCPGAGFSGTSVAMALYAGRYRRRGTLGMGISWFDEALRLESAPVSGSAGPPDLICRQLPMA